MWSLEFVSRYWKITEYIYILYQVYNYLVFLQIEFVSTPNQLDCNTFETFVWHKIHKVVSSKLSSHEKMKYLVEANIVLAISTKYHLNGWDFSAGVELEHKESNSFYINLQLQSKYHGCAADVALFASNINSSPCLKVPILIGEVASNTNENTCLSQLFYYMICFSRPYKIDADTGKCQMIGFLLNPKAEFFYIMEVYTTGWMYNPFSLVF